MMLVDQIKARLGIGDQWSGEVWGGFASMLVALPSSIAFGIAIYAVLGPEYMAHGAIAGILGAIAIGILAPLLGGAPGLISAPCAPAAAVMGALAAEMIKSANVSPPQVLVFLTLAALLSGALQLVYGAMGGGRFIKYIPYPVVSGYLSGVGVLIFIGQLPKLLGLPNDIPVWQGLASPGNWQWTGIVVGLVTIAGVMAGPRLTKTVPATIMGVAAGFLAYFGLSYFLPELRTLEHNKLVIGRLFSENAPMTAALEERWAALGAVRFSDLANLFMPAITLSVLLSIDTLKTCVVMDTLLRRRHNSNRELIGQGVANFASALMGGIPGAGTMGATLVNVSSGGKTRLSGVLEGVFVIVAFAAFAWLICWLPIAALAGILMVVAWRMLDRSSFLLLKQKTTVFDFLVIAAVVATAIGVNLIAAAGVGLLLAGEDAGMRELLERAVEEGGLAGRVYIPGPLVPAEFFTKIDALVLPSIVEGCPFVVVEAMLARVPVIAAPHGDLPLWLARTEGLCFSTGTGEAEVLTPALIAGAVRALRRTPAPDVLTRLDAGHDFAARHLTADRMVDGYARLIEHELAERVAAAAPAAAAEPAAPPAEPAVQIATRRPRNAARKPKVVLLADVPGWAFDVNEHDWHRYLDTYHDYSHLYVRDVAAWPKLDQWDVVYVALQRWQIGHLIPWDRALGALRSRWFLTESPGPATDADVRLVNTFRGFHCVTAVNYAEIADRCPNLRYLTNPVDHLRFPHPTEVRDRLRACWNGNALHLDSKGVDCKGLGMVVAACAQAGVPLTYAEYHTCRAPFEQMPAWYRGFNVAISMSLYEGASNSVMEAMATGLAVICTDTGNHREMRDSQLLHLGDTGIILVERSVEALAKALSNLAACPGRAIEMGRVNRREIAERWSWERWADRYRQFVELAL